MSNAHLEVPGCDNNYYCSCSFIKSKLFLHLLQTSQSNWVPRNLLTEKQRSVWRKLKGHGWTFKDTILKILYHSTLRSSIFLLNASSQTKTTIFEQTWPFIIAWWFSWSPESWQEIYVQGYEEISLWQGEYNHVTILVFTLSFVVGVCLHCIYVWIIHPL